MPARSDRRRVFQGALGERGAAVVEFALVLPILLLLVYGLVDFSRAHNNRSTLSEAAAEGARAVIASSSAPGTNGSVQEARALDAAEAAVIGSSVAWEDVVRQVETCVDDRDAARVRLSVRFEYLTPLPGLGRAFPITITAIGSRQCP